MNDMYTRSGQKVCVDHTHEGTHYGYPYIKIEGEDGEGWYEATTDTLVAYTQLFEKPPVAVVDAEIKALEHQRNELKSEIESMKAERATEKSLVKRELEKVAQMKAKFPDYMQTLDYLEMYFSDKPLFVTTEGNFGAIDDFRDNYNKKLRLFSFYFSDMESNKRGLDFYIADYGDGSGSKRECIFSDSIEAAQRIAYAKDDVRGNGYCLECLAESSRKYGVEHLIPEWAVESLAAYKKDEQDKKKSSAVKDVQRMAALIGKEGMLKIVSETFEQA